MNVTLFYFSQTGNTKKISNIIAQTFENAGHKVHNVKLKDVKIDELLSSDVLGIGCPTFESHAPEPVKEFIKSLPKLKNKNSFVFATGGGASGNVLSDLTKLLVKKGANVLGQFFSLGMVSHPAPCLHGKSPNRPNEDDLYKARNFTSNIINLLKCKSEESMEIGKRIVLKRDMGFYKLVGVIGSSNELIKLLMPKPKSDQNNCKQCNLCAKECPMEAISISSFPEINGKCIRCYRCMNVCPNSVFDVNWWYGNLVAKALWNETFMSLFGEYQKD